MQCGVEGQVLGGKYRLVQRLGRGGMGAVWRAEHLTLNSPVALKLIEPATAQDSQALQRFIREARTAAALRSPHVVQILDYGVDEDLPYIVMELLDGESLAERLARRGQLGLRETARIIQHVARALARAHDAGIVHRDLKPENVFIVENDDEEIAKVLDFGIVKTSPGALGSLDGATSTQTGTLLGTPYFMSPEQVEASKTVNYKADIWALGVIAYRSLLGRLPFTGDSVGRLILEICSRPLPIPSAAGAVPNGFDIWFARACCRDPEGRFSSAKQAAVEFVRLAAAEPEPLPIANTLTFEPDQRELELAATTGASYNSEVSARRSPQGRTRRLRALALAALTVAVVTSAALVALLAPARRESEASEQTKPTPAAPTTAVVVESHALAPSPSAPAPPAAAAPSSGTASLAAPPAPAPAESPSRKPARARKPPAPLPRAAPPAPDRTPSKPVVDLGI